MFLDEINLYGYEKKWITRTMFIDLQRTDPKHAIIVQNI